MASGMPLEEPFLAYNIRDCQGPGKICQGYAIPSTLSHLPQPLLPEEDCDCIRDSVNKREGHVTVTEASCGNHGN